MTDQPSLTAAGCEASASDTFADLPADLRQLLRWADERKSGPGGHRYSSSAKRTKQHLARLIRDGREALGWTEDRLGRVVGKKRPEIFWAEKGEGPVARFAVLLRAILRGQQEHRQKQQERQSGAAQVASAAAVYCYEVGGEQSQEGGAV